MIPPDADGEYVARMGNVLETYAQPDDPTFPVLCWDEQPVSLAGSRCEADRRQGPVAIRSQPSTTDRPTNPKQTPAVLRYLTSSTSVSC